MLPRCRPGRAAVALALATCAGRPACGGPPDALVPLEIELAARAVAPGEPLRVQVRSAVPLASAAGRFLGRTVQLTPAPSAGAATTSFSGWAAIDLARAPGIEVLEVQGRTARGQAAAGTRAVRIVEREFPSERLTVEPGYARPPRHVERRIARERERLAAVYAARTPGPAPAGPFVRPVPGEATSAFGTRRTFNGLPRDPHAGLDLRAAPGTPVRCSGAGRVVLAQELYYAGRTAIVDHGDGLFTIYAHLDRLQVRQGQTVRRGERVGLSGATGRVSGPHLHWGARIGEVPFDPQALLDPALFPPRP